ncbi:MAG: adenine deaminase [Chloroflexi bacterium]|nr:adenine deaminase [Chloroflexota bacterium]
MPLRDRILAARGRAPAHLVLKRARVVNVLTNEIYDHPADVAIHEGDIVGVGLGGQRYNGQREIDLDGAYLLPGLIDGHLHVESTMLSAGEFARAVAPSGTTSVVVDPHEIGNVLGAPGIQMLLAATDDLPLNFFVNVPSCVPASEMENGGHTLTAEDMAPLLDHPRVVGIAELMNFPGVLAGDPAVLAKAELGQRRGVPIDGHAPGVTGKDLCAYLTAGIESDHETTRAEEAEEKLRQGLWLMVREGSTEHNLHELLPVVRRLRARRALFVTDDRAPNDLLHQGHLDHAVRLAIAEGMDPVGAIAMATINAAERFRLPRIGAIVPGYRADLIVADDLQNLRAKLVFKDGAIVARDGRPTFTPPPFDYSQALDTVHIGRLDASKLVIPATGSHARVIGVVPHQIVTRHLVEEPAIVNGHIVSDPGRDILKMAVVERHRATGDVGVGLVKGFGLKAGALASSVAHDAHNIGVVGVSDEDMLAAVYAVVEQRGGLAAVRDGEVLARLPLPIGGLMSDLPFEEVAARLEAVEEAASSIGCTVWRPFMVLSFLALSVIPALKLTDRGLVDVEAWELVPVGV